MLETMVEQVGWELSAEDIEKVMNHTFETVDCNQDGFIDFEEFRAMVQKCPSVLSNMTLTKLGISRIAEISDVAEANSHRNSNSQ